MFAMTDRYLKNKVIESFDWMEYLMLLNFFATDQIIEKLVKKHGKVQ